MKKLVLKTAAITFACVIGLTAILFGIFALFIPKPLANLFDKLGLYSWSMSYYEKQYQKSNDVEDLYTVCLKVDQENDSERAEKYLAIIVGMDKFRDFCRSKDRKGDALTTEEYLEAKYVNVVYRNKGIDEAMQKATRCVSYVGTNGYTEHNPYYMLVTDDSLKWVDDNQSKYDQLEKIYQSIDHLIWGEYEIEEGVFEWASMLDDDETKIATRDLQLIANLGGL